jgi:hypothetical protein
MFGPAVEFESTFTVLEAPAPGVAVLAAGDE